MSLTFHFGSHQDPLTPHGTFRLSPEGEAVFATCRNSYSRTTPLDRSPSVWNSSPGLKSFSDEKAGTVRLSCEAH